VGENQVAGSLLKTQNTTGWTQSAMQYRTLTTQEADEWHQVLARLPHDIYFLPEYHRASEANGDGQALLFVAEDADGLYVHPFLLRPITHVAGQPLGKTYYDSTSVYGYAGPLASTTDPAFIRRATAALNQWCQEQHVITQFVRFHPLLDNHKLVDDHCKVQFNRETVYVNLHSNEDALWNEYLSVNRNKVRKAWKEGLVCRDVTGSEGLSIFKQQYTATMDALQAQKIYYFSDDYYDTLLDMPGAMVKINAIFWQDIPIAAGLFMYYKEWVHYHLSGSDVEHRRLAPNNLLLHHIAINAGQQGYQKLHLGGGRTSDPEDSLFIFKAQISKQRGSYYTGQCIHDTALYQELCDFWLAQNPGRVLPQFFPAYRAI
jgi:lipid II:glycine glycyltransferase (peptidoglycan interpeptide bridge formation enzyme)